MSLASLRGIILVAIWLIHAPMIGVAQDVQRKKPLAIEDLYRLESFRSPARFPNESKIVCERTWIDAKTKTERHTLWVVTKSREKGKPLEAGEPDGRSSMISPDGKWIAFLSTRPRPAGWQQTPSAPPYSDSAVDLWLIPTMRYPA